MSTTCQKKLEGRKERERGEGRQGRGGRKENAVNIDMDESEASRIGMARKE